MILFLISCLPRVTSRFSLRSCFAMSSPNVATFKQLSSLMQPLSAVGNQLMPCTQQCSSKDTSLKLVFVSLLKSWTVRFAAGASVSRLIINTVSSVSNEACIVHATARKCILASREFTCNPYASESAVLSRSQLIMRNPLIQCRVDMTQNHSVGVCTLTISALVLSAFCASAPRRCCPLA